MRECWAKEPFRRPNFAQLKNKFEIMLGEDIEYLNCNINAFSNPAYFNNNKPSKYILYLLKAYIMIYSYSNYIKVFTIIIYFFNATTIFYSRYKHL